MGYIDRAQLLRLADGLGKSDYGVYLRGLAADDYVGDVFGVDDVLEELRRGCAVGIGLGDTDPERLFVASWCAGVSVLPRWRATYQSGNRASSRRSSAPS